MTPKLQFVQKLNIISYTHTHTHQLTLRESHLGVLLWFACLKFFIHQCRKMNNTQPLMTTHKKCTTRVICKPRRHHLLGTRLNRLRTKHWQRQKAENWITTSSSFPHIFPPSPSKPASRETLGLPLQPSERQANPTVDPQEEMGSAWVRWGGDPALGRRKIEPYRD